MRRNPTAFTRLAVWLAAVALWLPAGFCLAQHEPGSDPQEPLQHFRISEYWLGLVSEPLPDALRAQLNLPENQGLLVEQVAPDSPAAAAALMPHDVLLKANSKTLAVVPDLIAAVDAAKGKQMELELLRKGKPMKVEVTPAKRPQGEASRLVPPIGGEPWGEAMRWAEQFRPGDPHGRDYSFVFVRPGVVLGRPGVVPDLPGNVTISITKQGTNPVKIVVTRDKEKWEVSEGELDKLPADLRPHVEAMLRHPLRGMLAPGFEGRLPSVPAVPAPPGPRAELRSEHRPGPRVAPEPSKPIEKQLEEMNRQLDEMRKAVDALRQKLSKPSATPEAIPAPPAELPKAGTHK